MGNAQWYYLDGETPVGPMGWDRIAMMAAGGSIYDETYVWAEGMADWVSFADAAREQWQNAFPAAPDAITSVSAAEDGQRLFVTESSQDDDGRANAFVGFARRLFARLRPTAE
jgi:hypothetical protein